MNTFNLNLDLDKTSGIIQWVTLRQGDKNGTQLRATIYDHGTPVTGNYTARFSLRHPGTGDTYYRETATYNNGVATVTVDEQYAATVTGITAGYFELLQGSTVIASTADFGVRILPSATDGAVPGEVYDSAIEDALAELDEATGHINQMVVDATEEYLNAHPELTTTVEDNSLTDAKLIQRGGILSRVDRLMYRLDNLLTATPAEAESVTVADAAKTPVAGIALYGKSTQDGTPTPSAPVPIQSVEGNLIKLPYASASKTSAGITWTVNADGTVTANGTATGNSSFILHNNSTFGALPAGTYTLNGSPAISGVFIRMQYQVAGGSVQTISNTAGVSVTFTAGGQVEIPEGNYNLFCYIPNGTTVTNAVFRPMLAQGSAAYPYVPYGNVGLWARGRNLLDSASNWGVRGINGGTGAYTTSTTRLASGNVPVAPSTTYTISANSSAKFEVYEYDGDVTYIPHSATMRTGSYTFTTSASTRYVRVLAAHANDSTCTLGDQTAFGLMLEAGSIAHAHQPYVESVTPIPLDGHTLRSLPDGTRDEVTVDERGHVVLTQRVGSVTLDGSVAPSGATSAAAYFNISALDIQPPVRTERGSTGYCDRYEVNSNFYSSSPIDMRVVINASAFSSTPRITFYDSTHASLFATWLQSNPVTLLYQLATPITHDFGTIDPTALVGPDMTATGIPTAPFALTYERDLNVTLARLEAAIADAATA